MEITGRGHLNTANQFDPEVVGGLRITGQWTFTGSVDFFQILVRSDGLPGRGSGETSNGIEFYLSQEGGRNLEIRRKGSKLAVTQNSSGTLTSAGAGQTFNFIIEDRGGGQLSFTMTQVGNAANTATVTGIITNDTHDKNFITFHNREGGRTAYLDNVSINRITTPPTRVVVTGLTRTPATGAVTLTFTSSELHTYKIEASADLIAWTELQGSVFGQADATQFVDSVFAPGKLNAFYRVTRDP